jgi:hypothetical protein
MNIALFKIYYIIFYYIAARDKDYNICFTRKLLEKVFLNNIFEKYFLLKLFLCTLHLKIKFDISNLFFYVLIFMNLHRIFDCI